MTTPDRGGDGSRRGGNEQGGTTANRRSLTMPGGHEAFQRRPSGRPPYATEARAGMRTCCPCTAPRKLTEDER